MKQFSSKNQNHLFYFIYLICTLISCKSGLPLQELKLIPVKSHDLYEYIDPDGKIIINPQFSMASIFRDGIALVKGSSPKDEYGYIDENGKYVILPKYISATNFSEGLAWVVSLNGAPTAIDKNGATKITLKDAQMAKEFKEGLAAYRIFDGKQVKWGFINQTGDITINPQFSDIKNFSEDKCAIQNSDGKWGYINKKGNLIINYQFDEASNFIHNAAIVIENNKAGVIDENGKFLINPQFENMLFDDNSYLIEQNSKWGWCDKDGKILINPQFSDALPFNNNNLAPVTLSHDQSFGYIDKNGKIVINPQFDMAFPFLGHEALVKSGSKVGFIDNDGRYKINPQFDDFSHDYILYLIHYEYGGNFDSPSNFVITDFFDIDTVINHLNFVSPEGQSVNEPFSILMKAFNKTELDFNSNTKRFQLFSDKQLTTGVLCSFYTFGNPFTDVPDGWYIKKIFNPNALVNAFMYQINVVKSNEKVKMLQDAIESKLIGYSKLESQSSTGQDVFKNDKQNIVITNDSQGTLSIVIFANQKIDSGSANGNTNVTNDITTPE